MCGRSADPVQEVPPNLRSLPWALGLQFLDSLWYLGSRLRQAEGLLTVLFFPVQNPAFSVPRTYLCLTRRNVMRLCVG